jgi:4-hydroxythreonine-4-phosphate dehydrogenase
MARKILALTPGDPAGIGPEILWKTIREGAYPAQEVAILCVGAREPFERLSARIQEVSEAELRGGAMPPAPDGSTVWLLAAPSAPPASAARRKSFLLEGYQAGWSIETATHLVQKGIAEALVTGPISKERLQRGGYPYPGHTEFLAKLCRKRSVTMMLANDQLRISLVTTHLALKDVPRALTRQSLRQAIVHTADHLREWFGIARPRIAVAALNPHAGESGLFGKEEIRVIAPEIRALQKNARGKFALEGPLPADTLFAKHVLAAPCARYDAVVCMYHDQGLIPVKLLDFPRTVNITLGLPIVRTSVDHGVGFDIAGTGQADPSSLQSAIALATHIIQSRRTQS